MKKVTIQVALLSLSSSFAAMGIGLGDLTVHSSLNQPFDAEIALFDLGNIPLTMVRANLAPASEFERLGLEMSNMVSTLMFSVERNKEGVAIIRIRSDARMSDPFMQILVDLAWAKGQTYRAYSLFLDPPNYQIVLDKGRPAVKPRARANRYSDTGQYANVAESNESTATSVVSDESRAEGQAAYYGPTLADETIWQIAERYRKDALNLQQVVLGIVGINPDAFTHANLNGLKTGVRLKIPSSKQLMTISPDAAKLEVLAHDSAWENKQPIQHVIEPPYMQALGISNPVKPETLDLPSILAKTPTFSAIMSSTAASSHYMPVPNVFMVQNEDKATSSAVTGGASTSADAKLRTEMDLAAAAIDSIREANALLSEQFYQLQATNKTLENKLKQRDQDMTKLQAQIRKLTERQGLAAQTLTHSDSNDSSTVPWLFVLVALLAGAGIVYRQYKWQNQSKTSKTVTSHEQSPDVKVSSETPIEPLLSSRRAAEVKIDIIEPAASVAAVTEAVEELSETTEVKPQVSEAIEVTAAVEKNIASEIENTQEELPPVTAVKDEARDEEDVEKQHSLELIEYVPSSLPKAPVEKPSTSTEQAADELLIEYVVPASESDFDAVEAKTTTEEAEEDDALSFDDAIEFNLDDEQDTASVEIIPASASSEAKPKRPKPVKSKQATQTLMALAKTYIVMGDMAAARESLAEVVRDAKGKLQAEAKALLDELDQDSKS